jgi:hypothetical protein
VEVFLLAIPYTDHPQDDGVLAAAELDVHVEVEMLT